MKLHESWLNICTSDIMYTLKALEVMFNCGGFISMFAWWYMIVVLTSLSVCHSLLALYKGKYVLLVII